MESFDLVLWEINQSMTYFADVKLYINHTGVAIVEHIEMQLTLLLKINQAELTAKTPDTLLTNP